MLQQKGGKGISDISCVGTMRVLQQILNRYKKVCVATVGNGGSQWKKKSVATDVERYYVVLLYVLQLPVL